MKCGCRCITMFSRQKHSTISGSQPAHPLVYPPFHPTARLPADPTTHWSTHPSIAPHACLPAIPSAGRPFSPHASPLLCRTTCSADPPARQMTHPPARHMHVFCPTAHLLRPPASLPASQPTFPARSPARPIGRLSSACPSTSQPVYRSAFGSFINPLEMT